MSYGDDWFEEFEKLRKWMMKSMLEEMQSFQEMTDSGELPGEWEIKPIEGPNTRGYVARGHFQWPSGSENRRFGAAKDLRGRFQGGNTREPLVEVHREDGSVKVYFEIPGVEKDDIRVNASDGELQVKAGKFRKTVQIDTGLDTEKAESSYRNGVLEVEIPKSETDNQDTKTIELE